MKIVQATAYKLPLNIRLLLLLLVAVVLQIKISDYDILLTRPPTIQVM